MSALLSLAGLHSSPNMPVGLARKIGPRGAALLSVQPAGRLLAGTIGWTPRGGATRIRAVSPRRRRAPIPGAAPWGAAFLPAGALGGRALFGLQRDRFFILHLTKRDQLGGDLLRDGAQRLPGGSVSHGFNHEGSHAHEVVKVCRGFGNVCRA